MPAERGAAIAVIADISAWWKARPLWRRGLFIALLLMALLSPWLADWLSPNRGFRGALEAAEGALERGELSRKDGRGARELFQSVLAIQPDQPDAQQGLLGVRDAALAQARQAIARRDYTGAEASIRLARELSASSAELQPLELSLRDALLGDDGIRRWMSEAAKRESAGDFFGKRGALAAYQRVLDWVPTHTPALEAREALIARLLQRQSALLREGDLRQADEELRALESADPAHYALPDSRAALATAQEARQRWRDERIARAVRAMTRGDAIGAGERYRDVLARDAADEAAHDGLRQAREALLGQVEADLAELRLDRVQRALDALQRWDSDPRRVQELRRRLLAASASQRRQAERLDKAGMERLLQAMRLSMDQGRWLSPPGDSAWDHLRRLRSSGMAATKLQQAERAFNDTAWNCQREAQQANRLRDAGLCLEALQTAVPSDVRLSEARAALAQRWRDWSAERIAKNQLDEAQRALQQAARWAPAHAEQKLLQQRLEQARSASPR